MMLRNAILKLFDDEVNFQGRDALPIKEHGCDSKWIRATSIWRFDFLFGYYTGVIPYKLIYNQTSGKWERETFKPQRVLCIILWTICCMYFLTEILKPIVNGVSTSRKPTSKDYFTVITTQVLVPMYTVMFLISFVKFRNQIEHSFNQVATYRFTCMDKKVLKRWRAYLLFIHLALFCVYLFPVPFNVGEGDPLTSPKNAFANYTKNGRERFFLNGTFNQYSVGNVMLGILEIALRVSWTHIVNFQSAFLMGSFTTSLWLAANEFEAYLVQNQWTAIQINKKYDEIKMYSMEMNRLWGVIALIWLIYSVLCSMLFMDEFLNTKDVAPIADMVFWTLFVTQILILCGETYRKMNYCRIQILEAKSRKAFMSQDSQVLLKRLLKQMNEHLIGVGVIGMYRMDYGFIAEFLVAVLTVFLISFES